MAQWENNERRFLSFHHGPRYGKTENIETAVEYDIAAQIDSANHWLEVGEGDTEMVKAMIQIAARGVNEVVLFCFRGIKLDARGRGLRTAIRRFMSIAWMLKSNDLRGKDGKPLSLDRISKQPQIRCSRCALSLLAQEFGAQWGFRVRIQKRDSTKKNYASGARRGWRKRRARTLARETASDQPR